VKLYYAAGVYVGTQADAKSIDKNFTLVEVPTDKDGLMAFLNRAHIAALAVPEICNPTEMSAEEEAFHRRNGMIADEEDISDLLGDGGAGEIAFQARVQHNMTAGAIVSRIDTPGVEQIVEAIATSKGQTLRRFAGAVAVRFAELGK
jgi:hypothetical protein